MNGSKVPPRFSDVNERGQDQEQEAQEYYDLLRLHLSPIWSVGEEDIDLIDEDASDFENPYGTSVNWEELR